MYNFSKLLDINIGFISYLTFLDPIIGIYFKKEFGCFQILAPDYNWYEASER